MQKVFKIPIQSLHPSQLYINESKLQRLKHLVPEQLGPLPVIQIGQDIVLTDGHTRALHAFLNGRIEIDVYWDQDELDMHIYHTCYGWCEAEGIRTVKDLESKIIPDNDYQKLWIESCQRIV